MADQVDRSALPLLRPTFGGEVPTPLHVALWSGNPMSAISAEDLGASAPADVGLRQFIAVEICAEAKYEGRIADELTRREENSTRCVLGALSLRKDAHAGELELVPLLATQQVSSPRSTLSRS